MTTAALIAASVLTLCLCVQHVQGDDICQIRGRGKLKPFSGFQAPVQMPCKYRATAMECQGYMVSVVPGQKFDSNARLFTDTLWISIRKLGTNHYWIGRTSTKRVSRYFNDTDSRDPFSTKENGMQGASFDIKYKKDLKQNRVSMTLSDASLWVDFFAYKDTNENTKDRAGVKISCRKATFPQERSSYSASLCGNSSDANAIRDQRKSLRTTSRTKTIIYDILSNDGVAQTNSQCETAIRVFRRCQMDRVQVIKECSPVLTRNQLISCLNKYNQDPMDVFVYCLKYKCLGQNDKCDVMKDALEGCANIPALPANGNCP